MPASGRTSTVISRADPTLRPSITSRRGAVVASRKETVLRVTSNGCGRWLSVRTRRSAAHRCLSDICPETSSTSRRPSFGCDRGNTLRPRTNELLATTTKGPFRNERIVIHAAAVARRARPRECDVVPKRLRRRLDFSQRLLPRSLMAAVQRRHALGLEPHRDVLVRRDHQSLDEHMRVLVRAFLATAEQTALDPAAELALHADLRRRVPQPTDQVAGLAPDFAHHFLLPADVPRHRGVRHAHV